MSDYGNLKGMGAPGSLGDSGDYNIDGCCYTEEWHHELRESRVGEIACGKIVSVQKIDDGYKEISAVFINDYDVPYGVAFRSNADTHVAPNGLLSYAPGDPISVVTHGRVWVLTTANTAPYFGEHVAVDRNGYCLKESVGNKAIPGWFFTGGFCKMSDGVKIAEVNLCQSSVHKHGNHDVFVNGCELEAVGGDTKKYGIPFMVQAHVSPFDATNRKGRWTVDPDNKGIQLEVSENGDGCMVSHAGSLIGDIFLNWEAEDGSGVQSMIRLTWTAT